VKFTLNIDGEELKRLRKIREIPILLMKDLSPKHSVIGDDRSYVLAIIQNTSLE